MSDTRAARRRTISLISVLSATLIATGALVAEEVGTTSPLPITIGVIGWMAAAMAGWAWMVKTLLHISRTLSRVSRDLANTSDEAREHREKLHAELKQAVVDAKTDLKLHAVLWLMEHQGQVQSMERSAHAMEHALGVADRRTPCRPDELAERRAAR